MKILMVGVKHTNDDHKLAPQWKQPNRVTGRQTDKRCRTQAETVAQQGEVVSLNLNYNPCKIKFSSLTSRQANIHTDIWIDRHTVTQTGPPPPHTHTQDKHTGHTYTGEMHTNTGETHTGVPPPPTTHTECLWPTCQVLQPGCIFHWEKTWRMKQGGCHHLHKKMWWTMYISISHTHTILD